MEPRRHSCKVRASRIRLCARANQKVWERFGSFVCRCPVRRARRRDGGTYEEGVERSPVATAAAVITADSAGGFSSVVKVWMSHGDQLAAPPPDFHIIGHTKSAPYAAIAHNAKPIYGIQFHPEVTHSPRGKEVIARFVHGICGCESNWTMVRTSIYTYLLYMLPPYFGAMDMW